MDSIFSLWGMQRHSIGAILIDLDGHKWSVFVNHFSNEPPLQSVLWRRLLQFRMQYSELPCLMLSDHISILIPHWDDSNIFKAGRSTEESQNIIKAREVEHESILSMGLTEVSRKIFQGAKEEAGVGPTRQHKRIDRGWQI